MLTVYYTNSFVPPELIAACGCLPQRLTGTLDSSRMVQGEGICAYTQSWLKNLLKKKDSEAFVAVFANSCDQMRRSYDLYCRLSDRPAFLLDTPATDSQNALGYYKQELKRLQHFLTSQSGQLFDPKQLQSSASRTFRCEGSNQHLKIALVGEAVPPGIHRALTGLLNNSSMFVALDVTDDKLPGHFFEIGQDTAQNDPLATLASRYFELPDVRKRSNDAYLSVVHKHNLSKSHPGSHFVSICFL